MFKRTSISFPRVNSSSSTFVVEYIDDDAEDDDDEDEELLSRSKGCSCAIDTACTVYTSSVSLRRFREPDDEEEEEDTERDGPPLPLPPPATIEVDGDGDDDDDDDEEEEAPILDVIVRGRDESDDTAAIFVFCSVFFFRRYEQ